MIINTFIRSKILREYIFIQGKFDLNTQYFIDRINEGLKQEDNKTFQTNVQGGMTSYVFFLQDKKFLQTILPSLDYIDNNFDPDPYHLGEAWGVKNTFTNYTQNHAHGNSYISGSIFLSNSEQGLFFEQINKTIPAVAGNFVLFSSFLKHRTTKRINKFDDEKYSLAFNLFNTLKS
jgi:hypothetical protein